MTEELNVPSRAGRTITLRRKKKQRGLEPANCYWIASTPLLQGKMHLDLLVDPPPDLAIEVEVTRRVLDRMSIYAALGVPEIWQIGKNGVTFHVLQDGKYQPRANSLAFPQLAATDLTPFLDQLEKIDDTALVKQFREWVRRDLMKRPIPNLTAPS